VAKYRGGIEAHRDPSVVRRCLAIRFHLADGRVGPLQEPPQRPPRPSLDEATGDGLGWRWERAKTMSPRVFAVLVVLLLAQAHPEELKTLGVRITAPGHVSMSSILHLTPFGDLAGADAEKKLHHEIAMAFTRMSPVKVTRTAKPSAGARGRGSRGADREIFFDVDAARVAIGPEALTLAVELLAPKSRSPRAGLTFGQIVTLSDEEAMRYLRGAFLASVRWANNLSRDPVRLDRRLAEALRLLRKMWPYVQLANTFSSMIEPVHREDFEELVRKACSEGGERE
jgi:hypothetical protein